MRITRAVVPSLFTVLNLVCGFYAVVRASTDTPAGLRAASWLIIFGGIFDALDGLAARLTHSSSEFGVELDSLADVVTFGAAPAYLVYVYGLRASLGSWGLLLSSLVLVCGALRLARFNVQLVGFDKDVFVGLPIPSAAIALATFILGSLAEPRFGPTFTFAGARPLLPLLVLVVSLLMVSTVKYDTLPKPSRRNVRKHPVKTAMFVAALAVAIYLGPRGMFLVMIGFIGFGLLRAGFALANRSAAEADDDDLDAQEALDA